MQSVCQQLQADIMRMKSQRAAVQRRMEAKEKEFRWVGQHTRLGEAAGVVDKVRGGIHIYGLAGAALRAGMRANQHRMFMA